MGCTKNPLKVIPKLDEREQHKKPCTNDGIKMLIAAIIERAKNDLQKKSLSMNGGTDRELFAQSQQVDAAKFFNSEYFEYLCWTIDRDYNTIRREAYRVIQDNREVSKRRNKAL